MPDPIIVSQANETSKNQAEDNSSEGKGKGQFVNTLALIIVLLSAIILIILIIMAGSHLAKDDTSFDNIKDLIGILLPVIGTWMGTILAFYFSKQNFEAANQRVKEMVNQVTGTDEKLRELKVNDVMLKPDNSILMIVENETAFKKQKLLDLIAKMDESRSERMPILEKNTLKFIFLIYRTSIERFILGYHNGIIKLNSGITDKPDADLTVDEMFQSDFKVMKDILAIKNCFLPISATLNEVKQAMQDNTMCQDVFITKTGNKDEAVEGWITNNLVIEKAELFKKAGARS